jgi:hypothetical protein
MSPAELLDRISILEIKAERIVDETKHAHVRRELDMLRAAWAGSPYAAAELSRLTAELKRVNEALWDIEDRIRAKEAKQLFDAEFVELARSVYRTNDRRAAIKREVNASLGSSIQEEKSYTPY